MLPVLSCLRGINLCKDSGLFLSMSIRPDTDAYAGNADRTASGIPREIGSLFHTIKVPRRSDHSATLGTSIHTPRTAQFITRAYEWSVSALIVIVEGATNRARARPKSRTDLSCRQVSQRRRDDSIRTGKSKLVVTVATITHGVTVSNEKCQERNWKRFVVYIRGVQEARLIRFQGDVKEESSDEGTAGIGQIESLRRQEVDDETERVEEHHGGGDLKRLLRTGFVSGSDETDMISLLRPFGTIALENPKSTIDFSAGAPCGHEDAAARDIKKAGIQHDHDRLETAFDPEDFENQNTK